MRMLDDVYGDDRDSFPLEQEARWRISRLEWEDEVLDEGEEVWYLADESNTASAILWSSRR